MRSACSALSKTNLFYRSQILVLEEGIEIEFKGSRDSVQPGTENAMMTKLSNVGETICAFLNTNGGKLYYGIHDQTYTIQGIAAKESVDKLLLRINDSLKECFQGIVSEESVRIVLHKVIELQFEDSRALPEQSRVLDLYTKALLEKNTLLRDNLKKYSVPWQEALVILEFVVAKHPTVVVYNGIAYKREENANSKMGFVELKRRIIKEHTNRK